MNGIRLFQGIIGIVFITIWFGESTPMKLVRHGQNPNSDNTTPRSIKNATDARNARKNSMSGGGFASLCIA